MKRIFGLILSALLIFSLSSCKTEVIKVDKIYVEKESTEIDSSNAIKSSCAITRDSLTFSGTVIDYDSNDGAFYIISYSELGAISSKNNVKVYSETGDYYNGRIVGVDSKNSMSLVKVNAPKESFSVVKAKNSITPGEDVFTVSTPLSIINSNYKSCINSVTAGIISGIGPCTFTTSATMNPCSYGGGVYDYSGNFLGILYDKDYSSVEGRLNNEGMTHAILAEYVYKSYEDMKSLGDVKRTSLGITVVQWHKGLENLTDYDVKVPDYDYTYVAITEVVDVGNSHGNLQRYDLIDYINGVKVYANTDISVFINYAKVGDTLNFKIKRYNDRTLSFDDLNVDVVLSK